MGARWRIELFGEVRAVQDGRVVTRFRSQKTALLLAYLAYYPHCPHRREQLCELLWPEGDPQTALANLRNTLRWLRQALELPGGSPKALVVADRATLRLNPDAVTTDVAEFDDALQAAARAGSHPERSQCLARAVELYRGELLAGHHSGWILQEREWLAERYFQALGGLIGHLEQAGDLPRALKAAHRGVRIDPLREEAHAEVMRLYAVAGQTEAALRQFSELERLLKQELDAAPAAATRTLARQIERQSLLKSSSQLAVRGSRLEEGMLSPRAASRELRAPGRSEGENRLVTVLFADMSSSVETMRDLPPEDAAAVINRLLGVMVDAVLKYEGHVDRFLGDGMLAVFGMLQAHEDDAERAIQAAIEIRESARKLGLEVSAGINTGVVYVGAVGSEQHHERTVVGPVVNLASRLQEEAEPGQLLVGETTYRQSRRAFEFSSVSLTIKGLPQPVRAYLVGATLPRPEKPRGIEGRRAELIGREGELARLREALAAVTHPGTGEAGGQMVSLIGEAGVGKSRLVAELKAWCGRISPLWLEGRAIELTMTAGYSLFVDLFRDYFAWRPDEEEAARGERLALCLREFRECGDLSAEQIEELGPLLGNLLSLRFGNDWDDRLKHASAEQIRHRTLVAVREFWEALARRQPVVLVCEDVHWADRLSLDLIALLMETLPRVPLLLLCVFRPEREHPCARLVTLAPQKCGERYTELRLRELSPEQSRRLIQSLLATEALPADVEASILQKARGNPFFLEEVVYSLIQGGVPARERMSGETAHSRERVEASASPGGERSWAVPESVQTLILSRVDRLEEGSKRVLHVASVVGRLFRRRLLEQLDVPALEMALWELEEQGFIYQERVVPEPEYSFRHVLTQETIYGSLLRRQRQGLHQRAGEAIENLYRGELEEQYEQLAYHYERSEVDEKAVEYLLRAGEKARRSYLNEEAIGYFRRALDRLDGGARAREQERLEALRGLGRVYLSIGRQTEAEACFRQALALGEEIGWPARDLARLRFWLTEVLWWQGKYDEEIRVAREGLARLGEETKSLEAALMIHHIAVGSRWKGDGAQWREFILREAQFARSLPYSEELRPTYLMIGHFYAYDCNNIAEAMNWYQALEQQAQAHHDLAALGEMHGYVARSLARTGDLRGAIVREQRGQELLARIGDAKVQGWRLAWTAQHFLSLGDLPAAEEYASRSREMLERVDACAFLAISYRVMGAISLCRGAWEQAADALRRAAQLDPEVGRAAVWRTYCLGRVYLAQGERRQAAHHFQEEILRYGPDAMALSGLEEASENPEVFRAYCRRFREEHPATGGTSPAQWFLEPSQTPYGRPPGAAPAMHDAFEADLSPPWVWHDPFGDCCRTRQNGLVICAANGRDLWEINLSAPRLLRPIAGDVAMQTVCLPVSSEKPAIGGILLWKDEGNFLRVDRGSRGPREISLQGNLGNEPVVIGRGCLAAERVFLRLERRGRRVRALCSADGQDWFTVGHVEFPGEGAVEVGVHAIGALDRMIYPAAYPEGTAIRFEWFEVWS